MNNRLRTMAIAAALAAAPTGMALAQTCPPGYVLHNGACYVAPAPGVVGGAANAAGAIVGGAVNTAGQIVGGTVGAVTGYPPVAPAYGSSTPPTSACAPGYMLFSDGACYPAR
ncbi:MAG TPA: hypothetical protein VGQ90_03680 [Stellaceae bacterium]|jgi:hypothetical protein|nr:hypothetical protein [Stellaceae bacterium]